MIDRFRIAGVLEGPVELATTLFDLEMGVLTRADPVIDGCEAIFQLLFKVSQMLQNGLH